MLKASCRRNFFGWGCCTGAAPPAILLIGDSTDRQLVEAICPHAPTYFAAEVRQGSVPPTAHPLLQHQRLCSTLHMHSPVGCHAERCAPAAAYWEDLL